MNNDTKHIIRSLTGELSDANLDNLSENFEMYIHRDISLFVPIFKHCDYAVTPNHSHPAYSFIYYINYKGRILVNGQQRTNPFKNQASVCAFSPEVKHQEIIEDGFSHYIAICVDKAYFEKELKEHKVDPGGVYKGEFYKAGSKLLALLKMLMHEHSSYGGEPKNTIDALHQLIVANLIRLFHKQAYFNAAAGNAELLDRAAAYMYAHFDEKIAIHNIAAELSISESSLTSVFKKEKGLTPNQFFMSLRIDKSKALLKQMHLSFGEIAYQCGFSSPSYFSRCFVKHEKLTPTQYRMRFIPPQNSER